MSVEVVLSDPSGYSTTIDIDLVYNPKNEYWRAKYCGVELPEAGKDKQTAIRKLLEFIVFEEVCLAEINTNKYKAVIESPAKEVVVHDDGDQYTVWVRSRAIFFEASFERAAWPRNRVSGATEQQAINNLFKKVNNDKS